MGVPTTPRFVFGTPQPQVICERSREESEIVSAETNEVMKINAPAQHVALRNEQFFCTTSPEVCLFPDGDANLPGDRAVGWNNATTFALRRSPQAVGLPISWFQSEMMMPVPTTPIEP